MKAPTAVGMGEDHHEQIELSRLIDIVNERFGTARWFMGVPKTTKTPKLRESLGSSTSYTALSAGSRPEGYNKEAVIREAGMRSRLVNPSKPFPWVRVALLVVLTLLLSGWTTCTAIVSFNSCPSTVPQPVIISLSPDTIPDDTESDPLTVEGSSFVLQSQIMWNGNALKTTFADSRHLQAMITKQTLDSFGGSTGSSVQISVMSPESSLVVGCPNSLNSATLVLLIN